MSARGRVSGQLQEVLDKEVRGQAPHSQSLSSEAVLVNCLWGWFVFLFLFFIAPAARVGATKVTTFSAECRFNQDSTKGWKSICSLKFKFEIQEGVSKSEGD